MKVRLGELRRIVRGALRLDEEAWMPGRYYPAAEPLDGPDRDRLDQPLGEDDDDEGIEIVDEVDTDPANNPGRPDDPYDYLGMHPPPEAAMAHPFAGGAGGGEGGGDADPSEPPDEPTEGE